MNCVGDGNIDGEEEDHVDCGSDEDYNNCNNNDEDNNCYFDDDDDDEGTIRIRIAIMIIKIMTYCIKIIKIILAVYACQYERIHVSISTYTIIRK